MPLTQAYILHYRSTHKIKYFISQVVSCLYRIATFGRRYLAVEIETFNHSLIHENARALAEFLDYAEEDFTGAFLLAMEQLHELILGRPAFQHSAQISIQFQQEYYNFQWRQERHYHPPSVHEPGASITPGPSPTGKTKGVFSKKQILILFDLLAQTARIEKIDLSKPNRYEALAALLHGLTGKSVQSWLQELDDHRGKDLYEFHTEGQRRQLIVTLTNMAELFRNAGFRSIAALADQKMRELERNKRSEE
jgi:hypothetical protein